MGAFLCKVVMIMVGAQWVHDALSRPFQIILIHLRFPTLILPRIPIAVPTVTLADAKVHLNIPDSSLNAPAMHMIISPTGYLLNRQKYPK